MSLSFWALALTFAAYGLAVALQRRCPLALFQPILVGAALVGAVLVFGNVPQEAYNAAVEPLSRLLLPATVCLAIPVYKRLPLLRAYLLPVVGGIVAGTVTALGSAALTVRLFGLEEAMLATLLPKSVTSAFGMALAAEYGGFPSVATAVIILTGIFGNITCVGVCRALGITHPVAVGVSAGVAGHAIATAKALDLGETQGAMAGVAMVLTGLLTTALMPLFMLL